MNLEFMFLIYAGNENYFLVTRMNSVISEKINDFTSLNITLNIADQNFLKILHFPFLIPLLLSWANNFLKCFYIKNQYMYHIVYTKQKMIQLMIKNSVVVLKLV